jgi:type I restriction enzyme S subunit
MYALSDQQKTLIPAFLTKYLTSPKVQRVITAEEYGMTRQALTKQMILDFELPLPPLNEQRRIVEKIEALTARSRKAREALAAIPELLDQFRQSVLAAAFRGDLTADWREQNPDVEPAEALLERIRVERRKRWEEAELEKMRAKGTRA